MKQYEYFVSYTWNYKNKSGSGNGMINVESDNLIKDFSQLMDMAKGIEDDLEKKENKAFQVVILNYKLLSAGDEE